MLSKTPLRLVQRNLLKINTFMHCRASTTVKMAPATEPAETIPCLCPNGGEAASVWRSDKAKDFAWRLKCLGLDEDPAFTELLSKINDHTNALEDMWEQQKQLGYVPPWWADGEYDEARADSANDEGLQLLSAGRLSEAFDAFTEAIRLHPTSPVYHCNRAAVALKLQRPDLAAEDADNALQRDSTYLKALLRGGRARLQLRQPDQAADLFRRAAQVQPASAAAAKGLAEVKVLAEQQVAQRAAEAEAAAAGGRAGMPPGEVSEAEAAEALYAARAMLAANPGLQAALCAQVEGLILCRRYAEAAAECEGLMEGVDRQYLQAEVAWRRGDLEGALANLAQALEAAPGSAKCCELQGFLAPLASLWREAEAAGEEGVFSRAAERWGALLEAAGPPGACLGLHCAALHGRAAAYAARGLLGEALADLNTALEADPSHPACLQLRAEVHQAMGSYIEAVLDLQRLQKVAPATPGLFALLQQAARLCLGGGQQQKRGRRFIDGGGGGRASPEAGGDAFAVLGLGSSATLAQIRQAYLKLAAKWHPDKWAAASEGQRAAAEAQFKEVQAAYEALVG